MYTDLTYFLRFYATSQGAIKSDIKLLSTGYILVVAFVALVFGKFNRLEVKVGEVGAG